jgi:DNA integrity scanning protein DisA with diadenylate cyclase activity
MKRGQTEEMTTWRRSSTVEQIPSDPVGEAVAATIAEVLGGASVELLYTPPGDPMPPAPEGSTTASATGVGPSGWGTRLIITLEGRRGSAVTAANTPLLEILGSLPDAGLRAAKQFWAVGSDTDPVLPPAMQRALRDTIVVEALSRHHACGGRGAATTLFAEIIEYLIELSGSRVESYDLTHGVIVTDALYDQPRLKFRYPADLREAKRAPLLFDGQRSVLVVDSEGRARTELQSHRLDRLTPGAALLDPYAAEFSHSGALVAQATRRLGGLGFFLRADRSIWTFADGQPLLVRRAERWTAFPVELADAISGSTGATRATAEILVQAAFIISAQRHGAILAIVDDPDSLEGIVSSKDRYDQRNSADPMAMKTETRLHHLIDAEDLDARALARFAALDGATILDRQGRLIAYGAIVSSSGSQFEGARTVAAKTLSHTAEIVLKVSADGDITVFRSGEVAATLLP